MDELLQVKNLTITYSTYAGEVKAVRDVSFSTMHGETTALVGESGCGKSATAKAIMGLIQKPGKISVGSSIYYGEKDITQYTEQQWNQFRGKECSMIFQDALVSLNPTMNIGKQIVENLENHTEFTKAKMYEKAKEMLELVGIPDARQCLKKYPHQLSGGMRQRVMIAIALIANPKLLIADEPTTALDVTIQAQIIELMKELQNKLHMAILIITHDLGVVADIADRIVVMYAGKVVEEGSCDEIFYHPKHPYTWALLKSVPLMNEREGKSLVTIEGSIPDMISPPMGCAFCQRCNHAMNICKTQQPVITESGDGHLVACWLMDSRAQVQEVEDDR